MNLQHSIIRRAAHMHFCTSMKFNTTGINPAASCGALYPPLRGIVQLTNFPTLRYGNWSFTNKKIGVDYEKK